jgi:hypothetical protein
MLIADEGQKVGKSFKAMPQTSSGKISRLPIENNVIKARQHGLSLSETTSTDQRTIVSPAFSVANAILRSILYLFYICSLIPERRIERYKLQDILQKGNDSIQHKTPQHPLFQRILYTISISY